MSATEWILIGVTIAAVGLSAAYAHLCNQALDVMRDTLDLAEQQNDSYDDLVAKLNRSLDREQEILETLLDRTKP